MDASLLGRDEEVEDLEASPTRRVAPVSSGQGAGTEASSRDSLRAPTNLVVFPSKFSPSWRVWTPLLVAVGVGFISLLISLTQLSSGWSDFFLSLLPGLVVAGALLVAYQVEKRREQTLHADMVEQGTWQEGVFVFPTGDVAVRFNRPGLVVDHDFSSTALEEAHVSGSEGGATSKAAGREDLQCLYLVYRDTDGERRTLTVDCAKLMVRSPHEILHALYAVSPRLAHAASRGNHA